MKRLLFCMLTAFLLAAFATSASADGIQAFSNFSIIEKDGKCGILDSDGKLILPIEYYIPEDQFDPGEEYVCVEVYQPTDGDYNITDLDWELDRGTVKAGFFHTGSGYFSQCIWWNVWVSDQYAAVCTDEDHYSLLNAETGEAILSGNQYAWICPFVTENWIYVWLWPEEIDEDIGPIWETVYINLDGTILTAPEGCWFSEECELVEDGMVPVYSGTGDAVWMSVEELLNGD